MKTGAVRVFLAVLMILSRSSGFNALRRRMPFAVLPSNRGLAAKKKEDNKYEHTILLPHTTFDQRANSAVREPEIQKWWADNRVYENLAASNPGSSFVLHDGPPYANGDLHIGHALNKILKDIVNRFQLLQGKKVSFVPGWDCHGLPIETKVVQSMKPELRRTISPLELRKKAAEFAENTMKTQRESFMRYGVWGHWNTPYLTLQPKYEASQLRVFGEMVAKGYIYRGMKPVHWSPSSRTALAEAELEYPEHVSKSVFIGFHVAAPNSKLESIVERIVADRNLSNHPKIFASIWTTTPWTIPANQAIAVHPSIEYALVANAQVSDGALFVVAKNLVDSFAKQFPSGDSFPTFDVIESISGAELVGSMYQHPLCDRRSPIVAGGDYITADHGTGLVHTAPGHGAEDYITGLANGLPIFSPVDDAGRFTVEAGEALVGLDVLTNGTDAVIEALRERGCLLSTKNYTHKYPHDWRTKKPTIFRATEQWFASISSFRDSAINATESVEWVPDGGKIRMINMLKSRSDWCISRQRAWGVPIPVFYHKESGAALMTKETIEHVAKVFEAHPTGSDAWWELSEKDLMPLGLPWENYEKGTDTMDVWFDSGTSWSGVLKSPEGGEGKFPSDMYLEGTDQFRGWFQSSLLTSVAVDGVAPYRSVLVHGFVLDEKGQKMSKSLGNVVDPKLIISGGTNQKLHPAYGADTLRMWAAGVDYTSDVHIGDNIVKTTSENCRKLRNTLRFLIGGLGDFDPKRNLISHDKLADIDRYILGKITSTVNEVENAYREHQFSRVLKTISEFVTHDLSAFYLDVSKDRLYISNQNDFRRRSCQTTFYYIMEQLAVMVAPIAPHLSEDLWLNIGYAKPTLSIFGRGWVGKNERFEIDETNHKNWEFLRKLRLDVNQCLEVVRSNKQIGATQHSRIILCTEGNAEMLELLRRYQGDHSFLPKPVKSNGIDDLRLLFISSQVDVVTSRTELESHEPLHVIRSTESVSGISIGVQFAKGRRCERCWFHSEDVGSIVEMNDLCSRCADVLKNRTL